MAWLLAQQMGSHQTDLPLFSILMMPMRTVPSLVLPAAAFCRRLIHQLQVITGCDASLFKSST
jgi:hypothetical protein